MRRARARAPFVFHCAFAPAAVLAIRSLGLGVIGLPSLFGAREAVAAKIVAEKNCSVRIDEEFKAGQKVFVLREQGGHAKKVAIVVISRSGKGVSLGKVAQQKSCASFKGLEVEGGGGGGKKASASHPGKGSSVSTPLDADAQFQYILFSGKGLHQRTDESVPSLSLFGFGLHADVWPGAFIDRNRLLAQMFGLGLRYSHGMAIPQIDVSPPRDAQNQDFGKQQTNSTTMLVEAAARYPYLDGKFATEGRVGYILHSVKHTLTSKGGLPRAPLRDVSYSGFSLGVVQRARFLGMLRGNFAITLPLALSGHADITNERTVDRTAAFDGPLKSPAGLLVDASLDAILGKFKVTGGFTYETYGAKIDLSESAGPLTLDETYLTFIIGVGVFL